MRFHIIWTCYGRWLSGDDRGYVDRDQNRPGTPFSSGNPALLNAMANSMTESAVWLSLEMRKAATDAIAESCQFHDWHLHEINVQPDHVHVVVSMPRGGNKGTEIRRKLKSRASEALNEQFGAREHWWTHRGKIEVIEGDPHLMTVIAYVRNQPFPKI